MNGGRVILNSLFTDKLWNYKNFNMVTELDIAGEFIYDGVHMLNQIEVINQDSMLFGKGFTVANLKNMRQFYLTFPNGYALRSELS